jgi:hypothetical protein
MEGREKKRNEGRRTTENLDHNNQYIIMYLPVFHLYSTFHYTFIIIVNSTMVLITSLVMFPCTETNYLCVH